MKVKELIKQLKQVSEEQTVYLHGAKSDYVDFTGISFDDINDIILYEVEGDNPA